MSDEHSGLSHDLPEYVPNWPVPVKVKTKVFKGVMTPFWFWTHNCPKRDVVHIGSPYLTQALAFEAALKHARGCW